jgi:6-phosphogluconolactonase
MSSEAAIAPRIEAVADAGALAEAVASLVASAVTDGVRSRGRAHVVLSGGSTPEAYLPRVAGLALPWDRVNVFLADERWVDEDSPHSNAAMVRRCLLARGGASKARFSPLRNAAADAALGVAAARASLPALDERYDLVLLGMGTDGHFASLFPRSPRLADLLSAGNTERVAAVPPPGTQTPRIERITMTLSEIRRSHRVVLVLQSAGKREVLERASRLADPIEMPVFALGSVDVLWCP